MNKAYIVYYDKASGVSSDDIMVAVFFCEVQAKRFIEICKTIWRVWIETEKDRAETCKILSEEEKLIFNRITIWDLSVCRMNIQVKPMGSTPFDLFQK